MSEIDDAFEKAQLDVKKLSQKPDDETLLRLYAYYKQASEGDITGDKPGFFDFVGAAKYDAWEKNKGMPQNEAKQHYTDLVNKLTGNE